MTFARNSSLEDLVGVVTDPDTWVFAAGSAAISAILAWAISHFAASMRFREVSFFAAALPVLTFIVIWFVLRPGRLDIVTYSRFLARPDVLLGLAIWFLSGLLSAAAVCFVAKSRKNDRSAEVFE